VIEGARPCESQDDINAPQEPLELTSRARLSKGSKSQESNQRVRLPRDQTGTLGIQTERIKGKDSKASDPYLPARISNLNGTTISVRSQIVSRNMYRTDGEPPSSKVSADQAPHSHAHTGPSDSILGLFRSHRVGWMCDLRPVTRAPPATQTSQGKVLRSRGKLLRQIFNSPRLHG